MNEPALIAAGLALFLGAASPGPSLAVVIRNTVQGGRSRGVLCAIGHGAGFGLYALAAVLGLVALMETAPLLFTAIQWLGVALLLWLAWGTLFPGSGGAHAASPTGGFLEGFFVAFLNPKIALFFLAVFSAVLHPNMGTATQYLIAIMGWAIDTGWYVLMAVALSTQRASGWLQRHRRWVDLAMGLVLAALAVGTAWRLLTA